MEHMTAIFDYL
ncbi:hypothetical protein VTH06DRAFT_4014 [Thermothelomyces fergusii]